MRKIDDKSMEEIRAIFDTTGGTDFFENIEKYSAEKATEMGYDGADERYFRDVFTANSGEPPIIPDRKRDTIRSRQDYGTRDKQYDTNHPQHINGR